MADRKSLVIDAGMQSIGRPNATPVVLEGKFETTSVYLRELRTDAAGRLIVLGGRGRSESPSNRPIFDENDGGSFNNADGWFDDTSDGPVRAALAVDGRRIPVEPAWLIVAPPNYAPDVVGWRTMHDLQHDLAVEAGWLSAPARVVFAEHVQPILARLAGLQWVNYGFVPTFGHGAPFDFGDSELMQKLATAPVNGVDPYQELRRQVYNSIRPPNDDAANRDPRPWPWIYSDTFGLETLKPTGNLGSSAVRDQTLRAWVEGRFVGGLRALQPEHSRLEDYPVAEQPRQPTRRVCTSAWRTRFTLVASSLGPCVTRVCMRVPSAFACGRRRSPNPTTAAR